MAGLAQSAMADNLTVANGTVLSTPQSTATAANGTAGNITTEAGSTVRIETPGAAITLNSNNSIQLGGLVENTNPGGGGIGVHLLGGYAGNFSVLGSTQAIINVTGNGTGNYGVLLDGASAFTGNISIQPGSAIIVWGEGSVGVAVDAPLTGNLLTGSSITGTGLGTTGVRVTGAIGGSYTNAGAIQVRGTQTFTAENVDPLSGSGIAIGASINGFLNSGPVTPNDGSSALGRVTNSSTAPAVIIAPSVAGALAGNITIGGFANDTGGLAFSVMNRGNITATENDVGISTIAMQIGETGTTTLTTLLTNGFYNRGSIQASAQSDNSVSTTATPVPTDATGLIIGNGATVAPFSQSETSGYSWEATVITGSTPSALVLGADASNVDGAYDGLEVVVNGQLRTITSYDVVRDANGAITSKTATLNTALAIPAAVDSKLTITGTGWPTATVAGSTTTTITLGDDASTVNDIYEGFTVTVNGETRTVIGYEVVQNDTGVVASKTLTLDQPLTAAPGTGAKVIVRAPPTTSVALNGGAADISGVYNGLTITAAGQTRNISSYVVIFDPSTSQPVMRVAKIESFTGGAATWASPALGSQVLLSSTSLFNAGTIVASMGGSEGGVVTGLMIQPGGVLSSITNYGTIGAAAQTSDTSIATLSATAINDQSGTLTTIFNHGTIVANATNLAGGTEVEVAIDLSRSANNQQIFVLSGGDVTGDINYGSGNNLLVVEGRVTRTSGNTTVIEHSTVFGGVRPAGAGNLDIYVSNEGRGGVLKTSNVRASMLSVGPGGSVEFALDKTTGGDPLIATTGPVAFRPGSEITITPTSFLPANGTYTLISAAGNLNFSNFGATAKLNSGSPFPFLLEGTFTANGVPLNVATGNITAQNLAVTLRRKTAAELGLQGNSAAIYEPLAAAALGDDPVGAALLTLNSAEEVQAAIATTVPDIAGGMRSLTVAMTDQATGVIGTRQRALLTAPPGTRDEFRFWGQEFYNIVSQTSTEQHVGYGGAGQGVALGGEWGAENRRFGVGYTFFSSQETERAPRETKTNGDWHMLSAYATWRSNDFFVAPQVNVGMADFKTRRAVVVGDVARVAGGTQENYLASGGATAGYVFEFGNIDIIPTIAIDMMYLNQGAYSEGNAGGLGLTIRSSKQTSVRSFAGVIGQGNYAFNEGAFMPQLLAGWTHEFANDPVTIDGTFESSPGSPFHLVGPKLDANKVVGGMSLGYVMRNWSAGFNYDASASQGSLAQSATFSISSRF